jgi:hypothetical protein
MRRFHTAEPDATHQQEEIKPLRRQSTCEANAGTAFASKEYRPMAFPLVIPTPKPPPRDDFPDLEHLDRPELDDGPDTDREPLPLLDWDDDAESGVVKRRA